MKKAFFLMAMLVTSIACSGQTLLQGLNEQQVIELMNDYQRVICKWDDIYHNAQFMGYTKTIEIFPRDSTAIRSIYFCSEVVMDKKGRLQVTYAMINDDEIPFLVQTTGKSSLVGETAHPFPRLEAALNHWLRKTKPGNKCRK